jgi:hypothetical protein
LPQTQTREWGFQGKYTYRQPNPKVNVITLFF